MARLRLHVVVTLLLATACTVCSVERGQLSSISTGSSDASREGAGAGHPLFHLQQFRLSELQVASPDASLSQRLEEAVFNVGMFAITEWEDAAPSPVEALAEFASCAQEGHLYSHLNQVVMPDTSIRSTLASKTDGGTAHPLPHAVDQDCPDFSHSAHRLRAAVGHAGELYARLLDRLLYHPRAAGQTGSPDSEEGGAGGRVPVQTPASAGTRAERAGGQGVEGGEGRGAMPASASSAHRAPPSGPLLSAARSAESLEHFHLFRRRGAAVNDRPALELHSDMGLFIVMTAAQLFRLRGEGQALEAQPHSPAGTGLRLELQDGRVVMPAVPENSLLVMNGEGIERWMPAGEAGRVPYAPGHEVVLPDDGQPVVRAWFGRMYLPPRDATLQPAVRPAGAQRMAPGLGATAPSGALGRPGLGALSLPLAASLSSSSGRGFALSRELTFGEYRRQTFSAFRSGRPENASAVGCSPTRRERLGDEGSCGADEVFCWMVCMKAEHLPCGLDDAQCRNPSGQIWPQDFVDPGTGKAEHCYDCGLQCKGQADQPDHPAEARQLCNSNLTALSMFMQGFQTTGHNNGPCLVYLFPLLAITSWARFFLACVGTVAMGVCSGALGWVSRGWHQRMPAKAPRGADRWPRYKAEAILTAIYAVRITLAYFLMLIAMTYQFELFVMVVVGLIMGHYFFVVWMDEGKKADEEEEENVDPCCC